MSDHLLAKHSVKCPHCKNTKLRETKTVDGVEVTTVLISAADMGNGSIQCMCGKCGNGFMWPEKTKKGPEAVSE